jgi:hypothetical protein
MQSWEVYMLQAAGALRLFSATYIDHEMVNRLAQALIRLNDRPPFESPTNQPGGWAAYEEIFQNLNSEIKGDSFFHIRYPQKFSELNIDETEKLFDRIPDLITGAPFIGDVLIALEWLQVLLPGLEDANLGDMILIDFRGLTKEIWENDPGYSLARGIASLRQPPMPVWYIQYAGQEIEKWGLPGEDRPIFTQHTDEQFKWMWEGSYSPEWPAYYAENCGLDISVELKEKCMATRILP